MINIYVISILQYPTHESIGNNQNILYIKYYLLTYLLIYCMVQDNI
jgi:hypothetical protein